MKAAVVMAPGHAPVYADFRDPELDANQVAVRVTASALSQIARSRASGAHYSSRGSFPFVVGVDGVGVRESDERRVYFLLPPAPFGAMAERVVVEDGHVVPLPDAIDDASAAAIAIPGMSSWAALVERARLVRGETVLINGATGTSGRLAVRIARMLGAARVIGTGRNAAILKTLEAEGADATVHLGDDIDAFERDLLVHFRTGVDVVLDYVWGPAARRVIIAAARGGKEGVPIRFVQIGAASRPTLELPSAALRSSALELMGSGIRSIALPRLLEVIQLVLDAAARGYLSVKTVLRSLDDVTSYWQNDDMSEARIVFARSSAR